MLFPPNLKENEYIRLVAIKKLTDNGKPQTLVRFVQSFGGFYNFIKKYRYNYDLYVQLATNRGKKDGLKTSQRQRRVLFLDFDIKDFPDMKDAQDCTSMVKSILPNLFIHACIATGHGYHLYISIKPTCKINELVKLNKELVEILHADEQAASPTQIARIPCSYNHKQDDKTYDYGNDKNKWILVREVFNLYKVGERFKAYQTGYIKRLIDNCQKETKAKEVLEKQEWQYDRLNDYPCYLCIRKVMEEGADQGQRNFWHGRIVKMLQKEGYTESKIYAACEDYNEKCRPPKDKTEIESDTKRFIENQEYKLLGCYEAFSDLTKREWIYEQCDKAYCGTYHSGARLSIEEADSAKINKKILKNRHIRNMTGNEFLIITLLDVYGDTKGRTGFRVKHLKKLLYSSVTGKSCISDRALRTLLCDMSTDSIKGKTVKKKIIEMKPDRKKPNDFNENRLKLTRKLKEFQEGYIEFYFSIAGALIDGRISQKQYIVFLTLLRNLSLGKSVTYTQLADDLGIDESNIRKHIKKLEDERCLIVAKQYSEKGKECNQYRMCNSLFDGSNTNKEIQIKLLS